MATPQAPPEPHSLVPARYRVDSARAEAGGSTTLSIDAVDSPLPSGAPGQFLMLWAPGVGEVPISIAGIPGPGRIEHTIRPVGAVTAALTAKAPGTFIGARGPYGRGFDLARAAGRDLLVTGGGIGLAPLRPVIQHAMSRRADYGEVTVLVGARAPDQLLYEHEFDSWRAAGLRVLVTVDAAPAGWAGTVGVVTKLIPRALLRPAHTEALLCGPEVMMRYAAGALIDHGVDPVRIQVSLERNMHCAVRQCGRCQLGALFVCHEGPVFAWPEVADVLRIRER